ncbi:PROBABLE CONSERVED TRANSMEMBRANE PROTEIN [Microbacterium esteraromaticum]|uniref:PROBABLE CONSERVED TRANSMEMBRANE PROTEIN n=1 Tax=Microbacterium esteraromaticum TaxID=57043 RepID=A0A1R4KD28_9MICO|nr:DUF3054 domain-containing protein [Microbacterium esteraromaticum]SJN42196.1 PROBABLE CONSERVED TRANSMEMBRANE PROTEIN [Microbacterium esteraromaticum]
MRYLPAFVLDAILVLIFAAIGRASHDENPLGFLLTAWPFLVALVVGHVLAALVPARPRRPWSLGWGVVVWVVTVAGGMLLRVASGDTAAVPFIIVATLTIGLFLIGWRLITMLVRRRRTARGPSSEPNRHPEANEYPEPSGRTERRDRYEPTAPIGTDGRAQPYDPSEPADPIESADPTVLSDPIDLSGPTEPSDPTDPSERPES